MSVFARIILFQILSASVFILEQNALVLSASNHIMYYNH